MTLGPWPTAQLRQHSRWWKVTARSRPPAQQRMGYQLCRWDILAGCPTTLLPLLSFRTVVMAADSQEGAKGCCVQCRVDVGVGDMGMGCLEDYLVSGLKVKECMATQRKLA